MNRSRLLTAACLAVAVMFAVGFCAERRELDARDAQLDSIRAEETRLRADSMGWETRLVAATGELSALLYELNDSLRVLGPATDSLVRQIELLGGHVRSLEEMYVGAVGQIEAHGVVHESAEGDDPDSVTADVDDGLLAARLFFRPPNVLGADPYHVTIPLVATVSELADGRAMFAARAADPRVTITLGNAFYQPPPPVEFCGWGTRITWTLGGAAVGALGWEVVR